MRFRATVVIALTLFGCAETQPDGVTTEQELRVASPAIPAAPAPTGPHAEAVDWDEASGVPKLDRGALAASEQAKLDAIRVPVLAFDDPALLATARVTHFTNWYVMAVESTDGLNMNIRGTRNAFHAPNMQLSDAARAAAENYTLTRTHAIVTVSWRSFGVSYSLDIECSRSMNDERCTEDEYALGVVERLGHVGGQP